MKTFLFFSLSGLLFAAVAGVGLVYAEESMPPAQFVAEPSQKMFGEEEEFDVQIILDTKEPVTSWQTIFSYDTSALRVKEIQKQEETFPYWFDSTGKDGMVKLTASAPSPGFQGKGLLATVSFEALQAGEANFSFSPSSLALSANDTNLLVESALEPVATPYAHTPPESPKAGIVNLIWLAGGGILLVLAAAVVLFLLRKKPRSNQSF
ncbi:MAG: hypothetical protein HYV77_02020 [Candidatus Wildermuthbacteria bacterium]|nr:hypothetical protein [Candidatus Wildermuthbacteria bacterium]